MKKTFLVLGFLFSTFAFGAGEARFPKGIISSTVTATTFSGALSGNASTASALAANPADCSANQFATTIAANGNLSCAQPAFTDISGLVAAAQLPNPSATTLGGTESKSCSASQWLNVISTSGVPSCSQPAFTDISGSVAASQMPALTGDVTTSAGAVATTIATNAVTNAKAAQMAAHTFKGNNTGSTANAIDLTATQATAELNSVVGDSGSGGTKGLVPAPGAGDAAANKYLFSDGTWKIVSASGGGIFSAGQNLITNNSWEIDTSNWTASAGTYQRETAAGSIVPPGVGSASWDPAAANDTLTANNVTVTSNDGLSGQNGVLSCAVKTAATDLKMQVYDGTNVISPDASTDVVPSSSSGFVRYSVNFIFPASGTIKARFKAQSNSVIAYIDDCYLGKAEGFNAFNAIGLATSWQSYTPTFTGFGTPTSISIWSRRVGDSLEVMGYFTTGANTGVTAKMSLGYGGVDSNVTSDSTKIGASGVLCGDHAQNAANLRGTILCVPTDTTVRFGLSSSNPYASALGNSFNSTTATTVHFIVPIQGWTGENAYRADVSSRYWSGYHDSTCDGWTTTSTSFADPSNDATCNFTELNNKNFGTVSSAGAKTPGITFTPSRSGTIWACASTPGYNNTTGKQSNYQLTDGTTAYAISGVYTNATTTAAAPVQLCGIVPVVGGTSTTLKIQIKTDSGGTAYIGALSGAHAVDWSLVDISQSVPAPLLTGSVTSNNPSGGERIERATIIYSAGVPAVNRQSGTWISSVTDTGTGRAGLVIPSGIFSAAPSCTVSGAGSLSNAVCITESSPTSTAVAVACYAGSTGALTDSDFNVICVGPR